MLRVEANLWCMLAAKYRNKEFLRGMEPGCWADYVGFLLGEKCYLGANSLGQGAAIRACLLATTLECDDHF